MIHVNYRLNFYKNAMMIVNFSLIIFGTVVKKKSGSYVFFFFFYQLSDKTPCV